MDFATEHAPASRYSPSCVKKNLWKYQKKKTEKKFLERSVAFNITPTRFIIQRQNRVWARKEQRNAWYRKKRAVPAWNKSISLFQPAGSIGILAIHRDPIFTRSLIYLARAGANWETVIFMRKREHFRLALFKSGAVIN